MNYSVNGTTILVTGAAGFIGGHFVRRLLSEGASVIALDNYSTGSRAMLEGLAGERCRIVEADVIEPLEFAVDAVVNLACPASPSHYQSNPVQTLRTSVWGAYNVLVLAQRHGARVVQASTSEIYGDPLVHPQTEGYWGNVHSIGPRACYDEGKRAAESLFADFHRRHGVDVRMARIFNTYGAGMSPEDGRVVSNFVVQALTGAPLTIFGDGTQTRSLCYVSDTVEALFRLLVADPFGFEPINVGNPSEITVRDLAARIIALTGSASAPTHRALPEDDPRIRRPDITRAGAVLGWSPQVGLDDGLRRTIRYFAERLGLAVPSASAG